MPTLKRTFIRDGKVLISDERCLDCGTTEDFERRSQEVEGEPDKKRYMVTESGSYVEMTYRRAEVTIVTEYHP